MKEYIVSSTPIPHVVFYYNYKLPLMIKKRLLRLKEWPHNYCVVCVQTKNPPCQ